MTCNNTACKLYLKILINCTYLNAHFTFCSVNLFELAFYDSLYYIYIDYFK